jgi:Gpi18-like mannosyltransferase
MHCSPRQSYKPIPANPSVQVRPAVKYRPRLVAYVSYRRLSLYLLQSPSSSRKGSLLYVLAPAPAIFSVPYTEPFFALFTFLGMLCISKRQHFFASLAFAASTCFRATGVLNAGFLVWYLIWRSPSRQITTVCNILERAYL